MWRNLAKQASSRKIKFSSWKFFPESNFLEKLTPLETPALFNSSDFFLGFRRVSSLSTQEHFLDRSSFAQRSNCFSGLYNRRNYASAAEAIASTDAESDISESEEILDMIEKFNREDTKTVVETPSLHKQPKKMVAGMGVAKYYMLKRRQIKMETEAWEQAAKEYQELLEDMCEQKLAPNLPYVKSLFLGWFEPLRDAIANDQEACKDKKQLRMTYAPYFNKLPADMMAVITMHKLVGLLMTNTTEIGSVRVVQAACQIGEAIEQEVCIFT